MGLPGSEHIVKNSDPSIFDALTVPYQHLGAFITIAPRARISFRVAG